MNIFVYIEVYTYVFRDLCINKSQYIYVHDVYSCVHGVNIRDVHEYMYAYKLYVVLYFTHFLTCVYTKDCLTAVQFKTWMQTERKIINKIILWSAM